MGRNVALTRLTSLCALGSFPRQRQPRGNRICLQKHKNAGSFIPHFFPELRTTANKRAEKALFSRKSPKNFLIETKKLRLKKKKRMRRRRSVLHSPTASSNAACQLHVICVINKHFQRAAALYRRSNRDYCSRIQHLTLPES